MCYNPIRFEIINTLFLTKFFTIMANKNFNNSRSAKKEKGSFKKSASQMTDYQREREATKQRKRKSGNYGGVE